MSGDELATKGAPAVIVFDDRSRATVEKNSRIKLERNGEQILLRVLQGALRYSLVPQTRVRVHPLPNTAATLSSSVAAVAPDVPGFFSSPERRSPKVCPEPAPDVKPNDNNCGKGQKNP